MMPASLDGDGDDEDVDDADDNNLASGFALSSV